MTVGRRSGITLAIFTVVVLAVGGFGYAAFSSAASINVNATAGTLALVVADSSQCAAFSCIAGTGPGGAQPGGNTFFIVACAPSCISYLTITSGPAGLGTNSVSVSLASFAPGDSVTVGYWIYNMGTLPAGGMTETGVVTVPVCDTIWNIASLTGPSSLAAGTASGPWLFSITLASLSVITGDGCAPPNVPNYTTGPATMVLTVSGVAT